MASKVRVVVTGRRLDGLHRLSEGDNLLSLTIDVTDEPQVGAAAEPAPARFGQIDLLVNNAGSVFESSPGTSEPPLGLPLGTGTLHATTDKNRFVDQETARWRALSESSD